MTPLVQVIFLNLVLYRKKHDQCVQNCVYRFPRVNSVDEEMSEPLAFQPVQHGSSWPGPRASVFLGFCRLEELRGGWRQGAACVHSDQWQLQERRVIRSFCFAFA